MAEFIFTYEVEYIRKHDTRFSYEGDTYYRKMRKVVVANSIQDAYQQIVRKTKIDEEHVIKDIKILSVLCPDGIIIFPPIKLPPTVYKYGPHNINKLLSPNSIGSPTSIATVTFRIMKERNLKNIRITHQKTLDEIAKRCSDTILMELAPNARYKRIMSAITHSPLFTYTIKTTKLRIPVNDFKSYSNRIYTIRQDAPK